MLWLCNVSQPNNIQPNDNPSIITVFKGYNGFSSISHSGQPCVLVEAVKKYPCTRGIYFNIMAKSHFTAQMLFKKQQVITKLSQSVKWQLLH